MVLHQVEHPLLGVTKMFQFTRLPLPHLCVQYGVHNPLWWVSPIRTFWSHRAFDRSIQTFAVYYVLHRLTAPRDPPCALTNSTYCWALMSTTEVAFTKFLLTLVYFVMSMQLSRYTHKPLALKTKSLRLTSALTEVSWATSLNVKRLATGTLSANYLPACVC